MVCAMPEIPSSLQLIINFLFYRLMLRNKADRATRALLREISRDNVDLFSSFDSTRSAPTRSGSSEPSAIGIVKRLSFFADEFDLYNFKGKAEKSEKLETTPEKPVKKEQSSSEKPQKNEKSEKSVVFQKPSKSKNETENKPAKKTERSEKIVPEKHEGKAKKSQTSTADPNSSKNNKKGRQTNNSLSTVTDTSALAHLENGGMKYRRMSNA